MKKKLLTTMLALVMSVSVATAMVGCDNGDGSHTHTFATEWTMDDTHHWKSATCEHTTEVSDKAEHNWGADNKCTVCQKEKTENGGSSDGLTQTEWNAMFAAEALSNCTLLQTGDVQQSNGISNHQVATLKFADNKVALNLVVDGTPVMSVVFTDAEGNDVKAQYLDMIVALLNKYECFEYDASTNVYNVTETVSVSLTSNGSPFIVEMSEGQVNVSVDGKLVRFSCKLVETIENDVINADMVWEFSDYGTTVID